MEAMDDIVWSINPSNDSMQKDYCQDAGIRKWRVGARK